MSLTYAFYPGCSLEASAVDYKMSLEAVFSKLGVTLKEIPDWNCCGASSGFVVDPKIATAWCARNMAWAEQQGLDIIIPCTGCLKNMNKALVKIKENPEFAKKISEMIGTEFKGNVRCIHPLEALAVDIGFDRVKEAVQYPIKGVNVAPYYGCYIIRPPVLYDGAEDPRSFEKLIEICGGNSIPFPLKTKCCGGGTFLTAEDTAIGLSARVMMQAKQNKADMMMVGCPLCDMLMDAYQPKMEKKLGLPVNMPVMYFTQYLGLAMGIKLKKLGLNKRFVSPQPIYNKLSEAKKAEEAKKAKKAAN